MLDKYMCDVMNSDAFLLQLKLYDLMLIPLYTTHPIYEFASLFYLIIIAVVKRNSSRLALALRAVFREGR